MLARHSVKSNKAKNVIDKTEFTYTDPWTVTKKLKGVYYKLVHTISKKVTTKHTIHMSPVSPDMQAFAELYGVDSGYGQLYHPINSNVYKQGGIGGFLPHNPFKGFTCFRDAMRMAPAPIARSCSSAPPIPVTSCLDELNDWLL